MSSDETQNRTKLRFKASAFKEWKNLDGALKVEVGAKLLKIVANRLTGEALGNRHGYNLSGLRKLYVNRKQVHETTSR